MDGDDSGGSKRYFFLGEMLALGFLSFLTAVLLVLSGSMEMLLF